MKCVFMDITAGITIDIIMIYFEKYRYNMLSYPEISWIAQHEEKGRSD